MLIALQICSCIGFLILVDDLMVNCANVFISSTTYYWILRCLQVLSVKSVCVS